MVRCLEGEIRTMTTAILDRLEAGEPVDFVEEVAVPLPIHVIASILGVPPSDAADFRRWSDAMFDTMLPPDDPRFGEAFAQILELWQYCYARLEERRQHPRDDFLTGLLEAEIDGERLNDATMVFFCLSILAAGNETTRGCSGWRPGPRRAARSGRRSSRGPEADPGAVEEMLRWVTPIPNFCRTATRDTVIRDEPIAAGDYIVMWYASANRDETCGTGPTTST